MNSFSTNKYLSRRVVPLERYSIADYRKGDIAIARKGTVRDVSVTVGCLTAMTGFDVGLVGTGYFITLLTAYIVGDKFDTDETLRDIADYRQTEPDYVKVCINAAIRRNKNLPRAMSALLSADISEVCSIDDALEMFGAAYIIYYNYIVNEAFDYGEPMSVINVWRVAENEQRKKQ